MTDDQVTKANRIRYDGGTVVDSYLVKDHHALRIKLALRLLNQLVPLNTSENSVSIVFEIGCATGSVSHQIQQLGYRVVAGDISESALKTARTRGLSTLKIDASTRFPVADGSYHAIFCGELIEHIFDTRQFLHECHRVLIPGGIMVLTTPNLASLQDRVRFVFGKSPRHVSPMHEYLHLHIRPFTKGTLISACAEVGFSHEQTLSNYVTWDIGSRRVRSQILAEIWPGLGKSLISAFVAHDPTNRRRLKQTTSNTKR